MRNPNVPTHATHRSDALALVMCGTGALARVTLASRFTPPHKVY
jgi:hypothetical protein